MRLGDVLRLRKEVVHPRDKPRGQATFVGLEHIVPGLGQRVGHEVLDLGTLTGRKPRFCRGDIVYGYLRPYLNKVWVAEFDGLCSVDQYVFAVDATQADADFVAWFMRSPVYLEQAPVSFTPGQLPRIRTEEVLSVLLELPPLPAQRRTVEELARALAVLDRARAAAEAQVWAAQQLNAAYLDDVFDRGRIADAPVLPLGECGAIVSGVTLGRQLPSEPTRPVPYLRVANVKDGYLDLSTVRSIEVTGDELEKWRLKRGDLLLTEGGDPDKLGRGTVWGEEIPECVHQNHIFRVRLDRRRALPEFVAAQIGSPYGKAYFLRHAKQTTGIATINQRVLSAFPVRLPPIEEQSRVTLLLKERLAGGERLREDLTVQLTETRALPTALLRRAFSGEL